MLVGKRFTRRAVWAMQSLVLTAHADRVHIITLTVTWAKVYKDLDLDLLPGNKHFAHVPERQLPSVVPWVTRTL